VGAAGVLAVISMGSQPAASAKAGVGADAWNKVSAVSKLPGGGHTATLLSDGRILLTGGDDRGADVEMFDPVRSKVSAAAPMAAARQQHTATLLKDGKVLIAGGYGSSNSGAATPLASAEVFDPAGGKWASAGSMPIGRAAHTATLLGNGKVLVAGGIQEGHGELLKSVEIFDPEALSWTTVAEMPTGRADHTATVLSDGSVLFAGGRGAAHNPSLKDAFIYAPVAGTWTAVPQLMNVERGLHSATLLSDGRVLLAGGLKVFIGLSAQNLLSAAEVFDPKTATFKQVAPMRIARYYHGAVSLPDGTVLAAGGFGVGTGAVANSPIGAAEIYNPVTQKWSSAGQMPAMPGEADHQARVTLTAFSDGSCSGKAQCRALAAGGGVSQIYVPSRLSNSVPPGTKPRSSLSPGLAAAIGVAAAFALVLVLSLASRRRKNLS